MALVAAVPFRCRIALTEPLFLYRSEYQSAERSFFEGSRQPCRPISLSPAAIAVRHLHSPAANKISTPAAVSANRAAAQVVVPSVRRNAMTADRPTAATVRQRHMAG